MKIRHFINRKNVVTVLVCVLIVALCVCLAAFFSSRRHYLTVEGSSVGTSDSPAKLDSPSEQADGTKNVLEDRGISVTLLTKLPEGLDPFRYIKQAYELKHLMAVDSFASAADIPINPAVQYAFCYLYAGEGCLVDLKTGAMTYRQAGESEVNEQITELFGDCPFNIKESELYASGKQCFEMWQPDYSRSVFATSQVRAAKAGAYQIAISFFEDAAKAEAVDTTVITVRPAESGDYYLASMT